MPFSNQVFAGKNLIIPSVQSPNYVPGSVGWSINRDGTAEFNNETIRGTVIIGPSGNQVVMTATVPAVIQNYYSALFSLSVCDFVIQMYVNSTVYKYEVVLLDGSGNNYANAVGWVTGPNYLTDVHELYITGNTGVVATPYTWHMGVDANTSVIFGPSVTPSGTSWPPFVIENMVVDLLSGAGQYADVQMNGVSQARGFCALATSTASSATVAFGTEGLMLSAVFTAFPGRAYKVSYGFEVSSSVANTVNQNKARFRLRQTSVTGTQLYDYGYTVFNDITTFTQANSIGYIINATSSTFTRTVCLTLSNMGTAGNLSMNAAAGSPRWLLVEDCGNSTNYSAFNQL